MVDRKETLRYSSHDGIGIQLTPLIKTDLLPPGRLLVVSAIVDYLSEKAACAANNLTYEKSPPFPDRCCVHHFRL